MLQDVTKKEFSCLDFLGKGSLTERILSFVLGEVTPPGMTGQDDAWQQLLTGLKNVDVSDLNVVILGGGTGLSNIVGGDSRRPEWHDNPFTGLKEVFPNLHSIVCVTDDGGSTGELLKDVPLIALGDLRHVLLSTVRSTTLKARYQIDDSAAHRVAAELHSLFNYRFTTPPSSVEQLLDDSKVDMDQFPDPLADYLSDLLSRLFNDERISHVLQRSQCLGNLLLAAAIYEKLPAFFSISDVIANRKRVQAATLDGLASLSQAIGTGTDAVLPCTTTVAQLQMLYANSVLVTSETKSGSAQRGYPVDRVLVKFAETPLLSEEVVDLVSKADIIIMAPGSLYTSIIPILQVPGLADLIRHNKEALKLLIANIWVQKGETDATRNAPEKKFHVSDLILAYDYNISGGIQGLFSHVLTLDLADISGSVLQNYAIEQKEPIYVDSSRVRELGFEPIEAPVFSRDLLDQRSIIQHHPASLALVIRTLWGLRINGFLSMPNESGLRASARQFFPNISDDHLIPCLRCDRIKQVLRRLQFNSLSARFNGMLDMAEDVRQQIADALAEIIWHHPDIHPDHLGYVSGICLIDNDCWKRCQEWDNVFSFYDPEDRYIKIRRDQADDSKRLEMAFLVGLGQSLLGNYAREKRMEKMSFQGQQVGGIFCLTIREQKRLDCFLSAEELDIYLRLSRMNPCAEEERLYTRVVSGREGFTPPGLLFGLLFAWYLDNRFAPNIDYKMSIMKNELSYLIQEQVKIFRRRERLIHFFRETVFRCPLPRTKEPD